MKPGERVQVLKLVRSHPQGRVWREWHAGYVLDSVDACTARVRKVEGDFRGVVSRVLSEHVRRES